MEHTDYANPKKGEDLKICCKNGALKIDKFETDIYNEDLLLKKISLQTNSRKWKSQARKWMQNWIKENFKNFY